MLEQQKSNEGCTVIVICVVAFLAVLGLAVFLSNRESTAIGPDGAKRFRARPGTTREQAVALTSRMRSEDEESSASDGPTEEVPRRPMSDPAKVRVRSLSRPVDETEMSEIERSVHDALNSLSPEVGIARLEEARQQAANASETVAIERALAKLYMQLDPPDTVQAEQSLDQALSAADTVDGRNQIIMEQVQLYLQRGETGIAKSRLAAALAMPGPSSPSRLRLELAQTQLDESGGALDQAAQGYADIAERAADLAAVGPTAAAEAEELAGLAVMRLVSMYRAQGMNDDADRILEEYERNFLGAGEGAARRSDGG